MIDALWHDFKTENFTETIFVEIFGRAKQIRQPSAYGPSYGEMRMQGTNPFGIYCDIYKHDNIM